MTILDSDFMVVTIFQLALSQLYMIIFRKLLN